MKLLVQLTFVLLLTGAGILATPQPSTGVISYRPKHIPAPPVHKAPITAPQYKTRIFVTPPAIEQQPPAALDNGKPQRARWLI